MANKYDFNFELSHQSVMNLIGNLKNYQQELEKVKEPILKALAEYTHGRVTYYIQETIGKTDYIPTGNLLNNIKISEIVDDMVRVIADTEYAKYVDFGTGVRGTSSSHPLTGEYGWIYNLKRETTGQVAHQFMYRAWEDLKEHHGEIVRNVLKERGLIK